jgi:membrane protease YdiL (CAAX protease family)
MPDWAGKSGPEEAEPAHDPLRLPVSAMFFSSEGLRALWGILLFVGLHKALRYCFFPLAQALFLPAPMDTAAIVPSSVYVLEGAELLSVASATLLMAWMERRRVRRYGFGLRHSLRNFASGLGWGVALLSLLVGLLRAAGLLVFDGRLLPGAAILHFGAIWLGGFFVIGLTEEMSSRGYLQFTLARGLTSIYRWLLGARRPEAAGFWTSAVILSLLFGYNHAGNPGESPLGMVSAGLIGVVFCLSLWRTGSLWWAIGFHTAWDWAQSFLFGVADSGLVVRERLFSTHAVGAPYLSGGLTGPEGSVFLLPVAAMAAAVVLLTLPRWDSGGGPDYGTEKAADASLD